MVKFYSIWFCQRLWLLSAGAFCLKFEKTADKNYNFKFGIIKPLRK